MEDLEREFFETIERDTQVGPGGNVQAGVLLMRLWLLGGYWGWLTAAVPCLRLDVLVVSSRGRVS